MSGTQQFTNGSVKTAGLTTEHPVADKIKDTLHSTVDTLAAKAAIAEEAARETLESGSKNLSQKQKEVEAQWNGSKVRQYATKNPVATAGIAFAAGMLLSSLLKK